MFKSSDLTIIHMCASKIKSLIRKGDSSAIQDKLAFDNTLLIHLFRNYQQVPELSTVASKRNFFVLASYREALQDALHKRSLMDRVISSLQAYRYIYFDSQLKTQHLVMRNFSSTSLSMDRLDRFFKRKRNTENNNILLNVNQFDYKGSTNTVMTYMPKKFLRDWQFDVMDHTDLIAKRLLDLVTIYSIQLRRAVYSRNSLMMQYCLGRLYWKITGNIYLGLKNAVSYWSKRSIIQVHIMHVHNDNEAEVPILSLTKDITTPDQKVLVINRGNYVMDLRDDMLFSDESSVYNLSLDVLATLTKIFFDLMGKTKHYVCNKHSSYTNPMVAFKHDRNSHNQYVFLGLNRGYCVNHTTGRLAGPLDIITYTSHEVYNHISNYYVECLRHLENY